MAEPTQPPPRGTSATIGHVVRRGLPVVVLLLVMGGVYLYWSRAENAPVHEPAPVPQDPIPVNVVVVRRETVPVRMRFLGQTEPAQRVEIRARVAGYLRPRTFKEGELVEEGQKLFQIDPRPFQVELAQAQAGMASAQATLAHARQQLKRLQTLSGGGTVTQQEIEEWETQRQVAAASVAEHEAQIAAAELQLGYTSIESPITGMIGQSLKDTGSYVDAGANGLLAVVQQIDPIYIRYSVTEQEVLRFENQVAAGEVRAPPLEEIELEVTLADGSVYPHHGRINFIDVQIDESTGTSIIRGQVPNPETSPDGGRVLKPGQFIYASLLGIERINVIRVPQKAVTLSPTGASVLLVDDEGKVEMRPIEVGEWSGEEHWIVESGLEPGDRVITNQRMIVRPGVPVTVSN